MPDTIRVLVVDDEDRFRETLCRLLALQGMKADSAPGGREAVEMLKATPYDVIVLDVKMPDMPGNEALPALKAVRPETEVLVLTGHASMDIATEMISRGAADLLLKPCPLDELAGAIRAACDRARLAGPR